MTERFDHPTYLIRKKVLQVFGATLHVYGADESLVFYARLKAFKLKEDIRLYTGEEMQTEVLTIRARQVLDFGATYDIYDAALGEKVGALRRKGLKSLIKDEWIILDNQDREIGLIQEDSMALALVRRFVLGFLPQTFEARVAGAPICTFKQNWNPFVRKITVDFSGDPQRVLDRRVGLAAGILLNVIEGKQG
ncbi:MAG: hypothetical protein ACOY94_27735 [Bacillota bacterium]